MFKMDSRLLSGLVLPVLLRLVICQLFEQCFRATLVNVFVNGNQVRHDRSEVSR